MGENMPQPETAQYGAADASQWERSLKEKEMYLDAGLLGKLFGSGNNCSKNIAGLTIMGGLLLSVGICTFAMNKGDVNPYEIWKITGPIITGALGFIFGQQSPKIS